MQPIGPLELTDPVIVWNGNNAMSVVQGLVSLIAVKCGGNWRRLTIGSEPHGLAHVVTRSVKRADLRRLFLPHACRTSQSLDQKCLLLVARFRRVGTAGQLPTIRLPGTLCQRG